MFFRSFLWCAGGLAAVWLFTDTFDRFIPLAFAGLVAVFVVAAVGLAALELAVRSAVRRSARQVLTVRARRHYGTRFLMPAIHSLAGSSRLRFDLNDPYELGRIDRLVCTLRRLNGWVPSPQGRLLSPTRLGELLWTAAPESAGPRGPWVNQFAQSAAALGRRPAGTNIFVRVGRLRNRMLTLLFFPRSRWIVGSALSAEGTADWKGRVLAAAATRVLDLADLPRRAGSIGALPFSDHVRLRALGWTLMGSSRAALLARTLCFRRRRHLDRLYQRRLDRDRQAVLAAASEHGAPAIDSGVLLMRTWPAEPREAATAPSYLGGLPSLSEGREWPRHPETGLPLHFLGQVDLNGLGGAHSLPETGRLLAFADLDAKLDWADAPGRPSAGRLIHLSETGAGLRAPSAPPDLPEIGHLVGGAATGAPTTLAKWPVQPQVLGPERTSADLLGAATSSLGQFQLYDFEASLDEATGEPRRNAFGQLIGTRTVNFARLGDGFPYSPSIAVAVFDQAVALLEAASSARTTSSTGRVTALRQAAEDQALAADAARLRRIAEDIAPVRDLASLSPAMAGALREAVSIEVSRPNSFAADVLQHAIEDVLTEAVRQSVSDPELAEKLGPSVAETFSHVLQPRVDNAAHVLCGARTADTVELLRFAPDHGIGMPMAGLSIVFEMTLRDFDARRFDRAYARTDRSQIAGAVAPLSRSITRSPSNGAAVEIA